MSCAEGDPSNDAAKVDRQLEKLEETIQNLLLQDPQHVVDGRTPSVVDTSMKSKRSFRGRSFRKGLGKLLSRSKQDVTHSGSEASETVNMSTTSVIDSAAELSGSSGPTANSEMAANSDIGSRQSSDPVSSDMSSRHSPQEDIADSNMKVGREESKEEDLIPPNQFQREALLEAATFDIEAFVLASKSDLEMQASTVADASVTGLHTISNDSMKGFSVSQSGTTDDLVESYHDQSRSEDVAESQNEEIRSGREELETADQYDEPMQAITDEKNEKVLRSFFSSWIDKSSKKKRRRRLSFKNRRFKDIHVDEESRDAIESVEACREILSSVSFSERAQLVEHQRESLETNHEKVLKARIEHIYNTFRTQQQKRTQLKYAVFSWLLKNGTTLYARRDESLSSKDSPSRRDKRISDITAITPKTEQDILDAGLKVVQMRVDDLCRALNIRTRQQMAGFKKLLLARLKQLEQSSRFIDHGRQTLVPYDSKSAASVDFESTVGDISFPISKSGTEKKKGNETVATSVVRQDLSPSFGSNSPSFHFQDLIITKASSDDAEGFNVVYEACASFCGADMAIEATPAPATQDENAGRTEGNVPDEVFISLSIPQKFSETDEEGDAMLVDALVELLSASQDECWGKEDHLCKIISKQDQNERTSTVQEKKSNAEVDQENTSPLDSTEEHETPGGSVQENSCDPDACISIHTFDLTTKMESISTVQSSLFDSLFSLFCDKPKTLPAEVSSTPLTSLDVTQTNSVNKQAEKQLDEIAMEETEKSVPTRASSKMIPAVPFQKSPSDYLQMRNQSHLKLQVRRSSSAPSQRGSAVHLPSPDTNEVDICFLKDQRRLTLKTDKETETSVIIDRASSTNDVLTPDILEQNVPAGEEITLAGHQKSRMINSVEPKMQGTKRIRTKRKKRSKRKSSRNSSGRSFLAPITEHAEENASKPSEDSMDKPKEETCNAVESSTTQKPDELALVVSYKLEDISFATFDEKSPMSASGISRGPNESNELLLQELTKSSSEDPKLFLSSEDTRSYDAESLGEAHSQDTDVDREGGEDGGVSTGIVEEFDTLTSNETGSTEGRTLESVGLSGTISHSNGSTHSGCTNSLDSCHSSGSGSPVHTNSLGSSPSSGTGTDNGETVWSPFGFRSDSSSGTHGEDFVSRSRTFESTITSECNNDSYDDDHSDQNETVEQLSSKETMESFAEREPYGDADTETNKKAKNPIKNVINIHKKGVLPQSEQVRQCTTQPSSPSKQASRGGFLKPKRAFGRKYRKEINCTVEVDHGSVGHTVLEVVIPDHAEVSKEGNRFRIPSPKRMAKMLRQRSKRKQNEKSSFISSPSSHQQTQEQVRDDDEILRGQSTIDSREFESREADEKTMIPMPKSLTQF